MAAYITRGLLSVLLERAETADPGDVTLSLGSTPASEFASDLSAIADPDARIITDMYLPDAGRSINSVFGMDLGRPAGGADAKFVSHPSGPLGVTKRDDLAGVIIVSIPPWDDESTAAFDRAGRGVELRVVDAEPPIETIE